jgi:hypothetical protein
MGDSHIPSSRRIKNLKASDEWRVSRAIATLKNGKNTSDLGDVLEQIVFAESPLPATGDR